MDRDTVGGAGKIGSGTERYRRAWESMKRGRRVWRRISMA
jgi:hypothetical protein